MKSKLLHDRNGERTFALVFASGDDPVASLPEFARAENVTAAHLTGIGTFSRVTLGFFDPEKKDYQPIRLDEQVEVVSLIGNLSLWDGKPRLHAHVTLGRRDGTALAGHLLEARVRPTLELIVVALPATLERAQDNATGLMLLRP